MTFGERLKKCRKEKRLTQKELAALIGASYASISNWEKDQNVPDGNKIILLIKALEINPVELVGDYTANDVIELQDKEANGEALTTDERAAIEFFQASASDFWQTFSSSFLDVATSVYDSLDSITREALSIMKDLATDQKQAILDLVKSMRNNEGKGE